MFPYLIAGAIGFVVAKLLEDDEAPKYADGGEARPFTGDGNKLVVFNQYRNYTPYKIAVDDVNNAEYITLWKTNIDTGKDKKIGYLRLNETSNGFLSVSEISIDRGSKGLGLGLEMYKVALKYSSDKIKGIKSYLPNRTNKKQIPKIYNKLNSVQDGDYEYILKERNPNIRFDDGGETPPYISDDFQIGYDGAYEHLIAPNGNPSNLTPEQYKLVRKPEFKAWFGDWQNDPETASKVVDSNGEPLPVYHGSPKNDINKFKTNFDGIFFTDNLDVASSISGSKLLTTNKLTKEEKNILNKEYDDIYDYNNLFDDLKKIGYKIEINRENTADEFQQSKYENVATIINLNGETEKYSLTYFRIDLIKNGIIKKGRNYQVFLNIRNPLKVNAKNKEWDNINYKGKIITTADIGELAQENKNDGSIIKDLYEYYLKSDIFIVFNSTQIKLADGTNTTFDGNNPDIRYNDGGELNSGAFKKWFGNSKVVDKKGNPLKVYHGSPDLRGLKEKYIFESRFADNQSFFFTDNYSMAKSYADPKNAFDYQNAEEGVIGLYLSLQNPLIVNAFNQIWRKFETTIDGNEIIGTRNLIKFAKNKGYDGVIVENVRDYYNNNEKKTKGGNVYVAFEPNQIKLADGSNTTFDGENADIRYAGGGKLLSYNDVLKKQQTGDYYFDFLFSNENSKFIEETIDISELRELNGFSDDEDEIEHTISYFNDLGMDEDYQIGRELMNKIVNGTELNPIVVDEEYKLLDGRHRLSAYSELYYYFGYDYPFDGKLKIYKRISN